MTVARRDAKLPNGAGVATAPRRIPVTVARREPVLAIGRPESL